MSLGVTEVPAPPNDDFGDATVIGSVPYSDTQSSAAATLEPGEPSASCGPSTPPTQNSDWYAFSAPATGSYTVRTQGGWPAIALYRGSSLGSLTEVACANGGGAVRTFAATAGQPTYIRVSDSSEGNSGPVTLTLDNAPAPTAGLWFSPGDPTAFDTISFQGSSYDPGGNPIVEERFDFGDGTSAVGCCPQDGWQTDARHHYAKDGDYTVRITATTSDGRSASGTQVVQVRTHDVAITKLTVPQSARVGQSRTITVSVANAHYAENVTVNVYRSIVGGGFEQVGTLTQGVPARGGNRTTDFSINYTFTTADATAGKMTFKAVAAITWPARDAVPGDNEVIALPTRVS